MNNNDRSVFPQLKSFQEIAEAMGVGANADWIDFIYGDDKRISVSISRQGKQFKDYFIMAKWRLSTEKNSRRQEVLIRANPSTNEMAIEFVPKKANTMHYEVVARIGSLILRSKVKMKRTTEWEATI